MQKNNPHIKQHTKRRQSLTPVTGVTGFILTSLSSTLISSFTTASASDNHNQHLQNILNSPVFIKASNTSNNDRFGTSVALSGNTMVVGAPREDSDSTGVNNAEGNNDATDSGAVYVFVKTNGTWSQQAYIKASNTDIDDAFGASVAISGNSLVVGAPEESSNATGINGSQNNNTAFSSGAAYVFTRSGNSWTQQAYLKASNTNSDDRFGSEVLIDNHTVVVGAPGESSSSVGINGAQGDNLLNQSGAAYVFTRSGNNWSQQAYIKASNSDADDLFASSMGIDNNQLIIGAPGEASEATGIDGNQFNNNDTLAGAAYLFTRNGNSWTQNHYIKASNTAAGDEFATAVDISGNNLVIGAPGQDQDVNGGSASFCWSGLCVYPN